MTANTARSQFSNWLAGRKWPREAGPQPTEANCVAALALGYKAQSKAGFAMALYLRTTSAGQAYGATNGEVVAAVGNPQLNAAREKANAKLVTQHKVDDRNGLQVYAYTMAKPQARSLKAKAEGATPKAPRKRKGKGDAKPQATSPAAETPTEAPATPTDSNAAQ